jgi:signal transduction histidine kinase
MLGRDFSNREVFQEGLLASVEGLRSMTIAPNGVASYIYPIKGNEKLIGHDLLNDDRPDVREGVQTAIKTLKHTISGPFELRQGGKGIVIRKAVQHNGNFWGIVAIAVDMEPIYSSIELELDKGTYEYAFTNRSGLFYGENKVLVSEPVIYKGKLFDRSYEFAAIPSGGWERAIYNEFVTYQLTTLLIMILIFIIICMFIYRDFKINKIVQNKTHELKLAKSGLELELTEGKRLQKCLEEVNETLEEKVKERTIQLQATNKELESFSYSVSHDLRAPLRHMVGFVELLNKGLPESLDEKSQHYLKVISDAANEMGNLIDNLLSFSRMGKIEILKEKVSIVEILKDVVETFKTEINERDVEIILDEFPYVKGDKNMLKLVFTNLISNALKFTRNKISAKIEIGSKIDSSNINNVIFYIKDNGAGFDMKYKDKLFGIFQRLHRKDEFDGTGVGLANVQRIIQRHGGTIWAESVVNEGATFYFTLSKFMEV